MWLWIWDGLKCQSRVGRIICILAWHFLFNAHVLDGAVVPHGPWRQWIRVGFVPIKLFCWTDAYFGLNPAWGEMHWRPQALRACWYAFYQNCPRSRSSGRTGGIKGALSSLPRSLLQFTLANQGWAMTSMGPLYPSLLVCFLWMSFDKRQAYLVAKVCRFWRPPFWDLFLPNLNIPLHHHVLYFFPILAHVWPLVLINYTLPSMHS